jgi:uncharacterized repeat protein (TIGR01451 family)
MLIAALAFMASGTAMASTAGNQIVNIAQARFESDGAVVLLNSVPARVQLDELLDVRLSTTASAITIPGGASVGVPFTLTNFGNGPEAFILSMHMQGSGTVEGVALDSDGNGRFDPILDRVFGRALPTLDANATVQLFAIVRGDASATPAKLIVEARTATGTGQPGTSFPGLGSGGGDAVVGVTQGSATLTFTLMPGQGSAEVSPVSLVKSQSVAGPNGSAMLMSGAVITYSIECRFTGFEAVRNAVFSDLIPEGTRYVPDSLTLDGAPLSDGMDADRGSVSATEVQVVVGEVTTAAVHVIQFKAIIQ